MSVVGCAPHVVGCTLAVPWIAHAELYVPFAVSGSVGSTAGALVVSCGTGPPVSTREYA